MSQLASCVGTGQYRGGGGLKREDKQTCKASLDYKPRFYCVLAHTRTLLEEINRHVDLVTTMSKNFKVIIIILDGTQIKIKVFLTTKSSVGKPH